jgi:hypothetical protein
MIVVPGRYRNTVKFVVEYMLPLDIKVPVPVFKKGI